MPKHNTEQNDLLKWGAVLSLNDPLEVPRPLSTAASSEDNLGLILAKLTELPVGVNELRASQAHAITRDDL